MRDQTVTLGTTSREAQPATESAAASTSTLSSRRRRRLPGRPESPRWSHRGWMAALVGEQGGRRRRRRGAPRSGDGARARRQRGPLGARQRRPICGPVSAGAPGPERPQQALPVVGSVAAKRPSCWGACTKGIAGGPRDALGWYDRYLAEAHDGVGVSDALGRKMTLLERWNRRTEALAVARDYLRRFPRGTYANAARALVRSSTAGQ